LRGVENKELRKGGSREWDVGKGKEINNGKSKERKEERKEGKVEKVRDISVVLSFICAINWSVDSGNTDRKK